MVLAASCAIPLPHQSDLDTNTELRLIRRTTLCPNAAASQQSVRLQIDDRELEILAGIFVRPFDEHLDKHSRVFGRPDLRSVVAQNTGVRVNGKQPANIALREFTKQNSLSCEFHLESVRLTSLTFSRKPRNMYKL